MSEEEHRKTLPGQPLPWRAAIIAAGPIANFVLAAFIFAVLAVSLGKTIIASIRTTEIAVGGKSGAVLLGPVAVDNEHRSLGLGSKLIVAALESARMGGARLIVLVGDHPYYGRFGFKPVPMGQIVFPGPVNPQRILAYEIEANALADYRGLVVAEPSAENRA